MNVIVARGATLEDSAEAVAVLRRSITQLCVLDHQNDMPTLERWLSNKTVEHFGRWLADADTRLVVALHDSAIAGVGALHRSGEIRLCYVDPAHTGRGAGRALLTALEATARDWDLATIKLSSSRTALEFYGRCGYLATGDSVPAFGVLRGYPHGKSILPSRREPGPASP